MKIVTDISRYQYTPEKNVDFRVMRNEAAAVIVKAGQGLVKDATFDIAWRDAKAAGLPRGSYWFYDSRVSPKRQAEKWVQFLNNELGEFGMWLDLEEVYGGPYAGFQNWYDFTARVFTLIPNAPLGIYTNFYYWTERTAMLSKEKLDYFADFPLWIAAYNTDKPMIPAPWKDWFLWQFTGAGDGHKYGCPSKGVDLSYYREPPSDKKNILQAHFDYRRAEYKEI